jgi:sugar phosphate isomerase/epimerase
MLTRRRLIRSAAHATIGGLVMRGAAGAQTKAGSSGFRSTLCLFSKHLPELDWTELARSVKAAGFDGVDLTVRAKGHVLPERAAADLPRAIDAIKAQGVAVPMITTELTSASDPTAKPLLQAAVRSGVHCFKTGYWRYTASSDVRAQVAAAGRDLEGLAALARDCGIELGFHNHAGYIGSALWDIAPAMDRLDARWAGYYFDPRHAVAEGGGGAWKAATYLVAPRLKMMALKDFYWEKTAKGWAIRDCPMGEGAVDWAWTGKAVSDAKFQGPISLHLEYEIPGSTPQERTKNTLAAAVKDLAFARKFFA